MFSILSLLKVGLSNQVCSGIFCRCADCEFNVLQQILCIAVTVLVPRW